MFERPAFLDFGFSCRGVHSLARFFLVVLPLAGPSRPPPAAASAVPASRGGVCKIKDAGPIPLIAPLILYKAFGQNTHDTAVTC